MLIQCDINNPPALGRTWEERQEGPDKGLISAWLRGIEIAKERPYLAAAAKRNELPVLPFRGGLEKTIKAKRKVGSIHYLAMWQGLRSENLCVDLTAEIQLTCNLTGVTVGFTGDTKKLLSADVESEGSMI
jgi:hypothetical protein